MDGGVWWATVHRAAKELDMTEWWKINNKPLYLLTKVFFSLFCPQECWGPRTGLWWHRKSWKWKDSKGITTISYAQGRGQTQKHDTRATPSLSPSFQSPHAFPGPGWWLWVDNWKPWTGSFPKDEGNWDLVWSTPVHHITTWIHSWTLDCSVKSL